MTSVPQLERRLGLVDAVWIGLGSMIGAGVFAVWAPAAQVAGSALLVGLLLAAGVAWCNARSSAVLAARYPRAGGTYLYGREVLGPWAGFLAGWSFVIGKTASSAAMALTAAAYLAPGHERLVAAAAVVVLTAVNCAGVTRTAALTRVIVAVVVTGLVLLVVVGAVEVGQDGARPWTAAPDGWYGVLQSAGLLFFAFAGYARIATLGEEVRDPERVIPQAIRGAFAGAVTLYAAIGVVALLVLGAPGLADSSSPLADVARAAGADALVPVVRILAALAALGALLALGAGIGRTALAMARERDLPPVLAAVHPRFGTPARAELTVGAVVLALVLLTDLRGAIGFSSFGVLLYYLVANLAAHRVEGAFRARLRATLGAAGCVLLVVTLPAAAVGVGVVVLLVGIVGRAVAVKLR